MDWYLDCTRSGPHFERITVEDEGATLRSSGFRQGNSCEEVVRTCDGVGASRSAQQYHAYARPTWGVHSLMWVSNVQKACRGCCVPTVIRDRSVIWRA